MFSVVLPTFNRQGFILATINSILNQSFHNFEIILVDDGSTDNTRVLIEENFGANKRVRYFYKKNGERGAARNFGAKQAAGEFLVFLDSDDKMSSNYLTSLYEAIQQNPSIDFFACKYDIRNGDEKRDSPINRLQQGIYNYKELLKGNIFACNVCVRNGDNVIPFVEDRCYASMEDWIYLIQNLRKKELLFIDRKGVDMLDHADRSMANNQKVISTRLKAMDFLVEKEGFNELELNELRNYTYYFCAIHSYLDYNRPEAIKYYKKIIDNQGLNFNKYLLFCKIIIGRKVIERIPKKKSSRLKSTRHKELTIN